MVYFRPTLPRHLVWSLVGFEGARSLRRRLRSLRRRLRRLVAAEPARRREFRDDVRPDEKVTLPSSTPSFAARATLHLRARHRGEERHPFHRLPGTRGTAAAEPANHRRARALGQFAETSGAHAAPRADIVWFGVAIAV